LVDFRRTVGGKTERNKSEEMNMASAATTRILEENPANIVSIFQTKPDSERTSEGVPIVFLITSDEQEPLKSLFVREGWRFETFESAREFLDRSRPLVPSCVILDLSPELNRIGEAQ
jgi:hypothetical protein